ncbi:MAG: hypothetical protein ACYDCN_08090 [Bacteroidia bacterium]
MDQKQENDFNMLSAVRKVMNDNNAIWSANPVVTSAVGTLTSDIGASNSTVSNQRQNVGGIVATKKQVKETLIEDTVALALAGKAYAAFVNNTTLKAACLITKTQLERTTEESLAAVCQTLHDDVDPYIPSMGGYGVSPATQVALQSGITNFGGLVGTPRAVQAIQVAATTMLDEQLRVAKLFVKEQLDGLINQYKTAHQAFYKAYHTARKVVHHGHKTKVMVIGVVTDAGVLAANALLTATTGTHPKKKHKKKTKIDGKYKLLFQPPVNTVITAELPDGRKQTKTIVSKVPQTIKYNFVF